MKSSRRVEDQENQDRISLIDLSVNHAVDLNRFRKEPQRTCKGHELIETRASIGLDDDLMNNIQKFTRNQRKSRLITFFPFSDYFFIKKIFNYFICIWIISSYANETLYEQKLKSMTYQASTFL